jgi:hypothetical protein
MEAGEFSSSRSSIGDSLLYNNMGRQTVTTVALVARLWSSEVGQKVISFGACVFPAL